MNKNHRLGVYAQLTNQYMDRADRLFEKTASMTLLAIEQLDRYQRLRPDAIHFLLINMTEMVAKPLQIIEGQELHNEDPRNSIDTRQIISDDIRMILAAAEILSPRAKISAHTILLATALVYPRLHSSKRRLWG